MFKKILSFVLATIMALGVVTVTASAEDVSEPTTEEAYVSVEHKIEDIIAAIEAGESYYINPTDTIILVEKDEEEETTEAVDAAEETEEETTTAPSISEILIVEYTTDFNDGSESASAAGYTKFTDYDASGYAVLELGKRTDYAFKGAVRSTNIAIDFKSGLDYAFKAWRVTSVYSGKEFNRVTLVAEWEIPALTGWQGFLELFRGYMKTYIDALTEYLADLFKRIAAFFV
ncbi:MAG: hypothetical protein IJB86_06310 [Clostridia bacterium]|nr:hypothetical protein [Clostridia bacterium]